MTDTPEEPTASTPATEPVAEVESETAADFAPPAAEDASSGTPAPVDTVTRKSAALAMAACLLVGGAIGWLGAGAFDDDDDIPISAFGEGRVGERGEGRGGFPGGGRGPEGGFPEGGFPGGPMGPGGGFPGEQGEGWGDGDHPMPPWHDESEDGEDRSQDDGDQEDGDREDGDQDGREDDGTPSSTTES